MNTNLEYMHLQLACLSTMKLRPNELGNKKKMKKKKEEDNYHEEEVEDETQKKTNTKRGTDKSKT